MRLRSKPTNRITEIKITSSRDERVKCFMEGNSSLYVTTMPDLVAMGVVVEEIKCF